MVKYKQVFQEMLSQNKELFDNFRQIHDLYSQNPVENQNQFNEVGEKVLAVIRKYENRLCSHSESSGYGKYTSTLADKFQAEVKNTFPKIGWIGVQRG